MLTGIIYYILTEGVKQRRPRGQLSPIKISFNLILNYTKENRNTIQDTKIVLIF